MKVAVLYGQQHHGSTYKLTQLLLEKLDCKKEDISEFCANGMPQCVGCAQCITKDEKLCPHRAQVGPVIEAIEQADVIIFATPNYCFSMTGQMKSFCDHMAYRWIVHRPCDMRGKVGIAVSTAAGGGAGAAAKSVIKQMGWWSVGRRYKLTAILSAESWDKIAPKRMAAMQRNVARLAAKVNRAAGHSTPDIKTRFMFGMMKKMHAGDGWNPVERDYWRAQKW